MHNIASLYTELATLENFETNEGIKNACKYFRVCVLCSFPNKIQLASGIFDRLKKSLEDCPEAAVSQDMSADSLKMFSLLALAQAQELFFLMVGL